MINATCEHILNKHNKSKSDEDKTNRQVGTAAAGPRRAPRSRINSYISGENDEKADAQRKTDETEMRQT